MKTDGPATMAGTISQGDSTAQRMPSITSPKNANFNRDRYRVLEDEWAKAKRAGKEVTVPIVPHYREGALRPFEIDVSFTVDGQKRSIKCPMSERRNAVADD
ncbi:hypothetical protein E5A73_09885 [Sphingomonas gei]|uniref:Type VII secretion system protein EssD-like domain-containing protein n=1 Tax=Sphingomonas gei TaxID=1395960 RepID=A0A4S1XCN2_9SPHN|nr:DNA/RNA non-specific endonuclease [Sphingomonas gei]TGX53170.1 hypothetical protein E5A73_09885 [Sphingomonas gei]